MRVRATGVLHVVRFLGERVEEPAQDEHVEVCERAEGGGGHVEALAGGERAVEGLAIKGKAGGVTLSRWRGCA